MNEEHPRTSGRRTTDNTNNAKFWLPIIIMLFVSFGGILWGITGNNSSTAIIELKVTAKENSVRIQRLEEIVARNTMAYEFIQKQLAAIEDLVRGRK